MKSILVCLLGAFVLIETASSLAPYNTVYMQDKYYCHLNRNITIGQGTWSHYGFLFDNEDDCYSLNSNCSLILTAPFDYHITLSYLDFEVDCNGDTLYIGEGSKSYGSCGFDTPYYSDNSKSNIYTFRFVTGSYHSKCLAGFSIVYTSFHYGECTSNEFRCADDDKCIPSGVKCDYYNNCGDWSDEIDCPPSTGVMVAITVTFSVALISCFAFVVRRTHRRKSRHHRRNSSRQNSVPATPNEPIPITEPVPITESIPISTIQVIQPPKYVDAPPSYTDIYSNPAVDGVYETSNSDNGVDPPPTYESAVTHPCETNT